MVSSSYFYLCSQKWSIFCIDRVYRLFIILWIEFITKIGNERWDGVCFKKKCRLEMNGEELRNRKYSCNHVFGHCTGGRVYFGGRSLKCVTSSPLRCDKF